MIIHKNPPYQNCKSLVDTVEIKRSDVTISSGVLFGYHPMIVLASAKSSYDYSSYRQVKKLLPIINKIINEYTAYLVTKE